MKIHWQSKLVLLVVLPFAVAGVVLQAHWWAVNLGPVALWTLALSLLLGLATWKLGAATADGAFCGAVLTARLIFSTANYPYRPWRTALIPVLAVSLLAHFATRLGRERKQRLGVAERSGGRNGAQIAANLGVAALASHELAQGWMMDSRWFSPAAMASMLIFAPGLAALAEAAADTVSSEVGQAFGGRPRLITTLRPMEPGTNGAVSLLGTLAGVGAAALVALAGSLALAGGASLFWISLAGGVFGLLFDSLLGATIERRGWLNNDAVNFLSTASAACFALAVMATLHPRWG
jgi:uncharacterized protein (TIGR00297 family)